MEISENLRGFGFCQIKWTVKNFFGAISKEKWVIQSPVFTIEGKICTSWRFCLKENYIDERYTVCMYLEKVSHSFEEPVWVTWKLFFPIEMGQMSLEVESDFENNPMHGIEISQNGELEKIMQRKDKDILILKSMIFVSAKNSQVHKRSSNPNFKALSQDMTTLYRVIKNRDLKLLIDGFSVKFHKGVLSCRNDILKTAIDEQEVVSFPGFDTDAIGKVFGYLYTGNLDYILRKPTFSILQCIKDLGLTQLKEYYNPDYIKLWSKFKMETSKLEFAIDVEKLANQREIMCFPSVENGSSILERIFTLIFYPEGMNEESNYTSISIKNMENSFLHISHCEVSILDSKDKSQNLQRKRCHYYDDAINFEEFLSKDDLRNSAYISGGNLRILCKLYVCDTNSEFFSTWKNHIVYYDIVVEPEIHYKKLSCDMSLLFESRAYCDFTLICNEMLFPVHSFILSARSCVFRDLFSKRFLQATNCMNLSSINSDVLKSVLMYMYSGELLYYEDDDLFEIYETAERFLILPLKCECSKRLQKNLEYLDAKSVLCLAEKYKDYKLQMYVENFIS